MFTRYISRLLIFVFIICLNVNSVQASRFYFYNEKNIMKKYYVGDYEWIISKSVRKKSKFKKLSKDMQKMILAICIEEFDMDSYLKLAGKIYHDDEFAIAVLNVYIHKGKIKLDRTTKRRMSRTSDGVFVKEIIEKNELPLYRNNDDESYRIYTERQKIVTGMKNRGFIEDYYTRKTVENLVKLTERGFHSNSFTKELPAPDMSIATENYMEFVIKLVLLPYCQNQKHAAEILFCRKVD